MKLQVIKYDKGIVAIAADNVKTYSMFGYGVQLIDGNGIVHHLGDMSSFANGI